MTDSPVAMPPLKLHKNKDYTYVFTYTGIWEPAVKDADGNVIRKGRSRTINRKTVGKIIGGGDSGVICFYEEFLDSHPELRDYIVVRNPDGTLTCTRISGQTADNKSDREQISALIGHHGYELDDSGRVTRSADGAPVGTYPSDVFESSFEAKRKVLNNKTLTDTDGSQICTKMAGSVLYLDHLSFKTGVRAALVKTFEQICKVRTKDALHGANHIETVVYNMIVSGESTCEGLPNFCSEHAVADCVSGRRSSFLKYINHVDKAFIDCFHQNFLEEYFKGKSGRVLNSGIIAAVDGCSFKRKNNEGMFGEMDSSKDGTFKDQPYVQFVCDADKRGFPFFYVLYDGQDSEYCALQSIMKKLETCNVSSGKTCIVVDRGRPSDEAVGELLRSGHTFVVNCNKGGAAVQEVISKAIKDNICGNSTFIELDSQSMHYAAYTRAYSCDAAPVPAPSPAPAPTSAEVSAVAPATAPAGAEGKEASGHASEELRYHVFFDSEVQHHAVKKLNHELIELTRAVTRGKRLTERQEGLLKKYSDYDVSKYVEGMPDTAPVYLSSRMEEGTKYEGFRVLITNDLSLSSAMVLALYESCPQVDTSIQDIKQHTEGSTTEPETDSELQSRIFLQYLAAILRSAMSNDIADVRARVDVKYSDMLCSTRDFLDSLDSIVVDQYSAGIVCNPVPASQAKLLKKLGVPLPKSML